MGLGSGSGGPALLPQHTGLPRAQPTPHRCWHQMPASLEKPQVGRLWVAQRRSREQGQAMLAPVGTATAYGSAMAAAHEPHGSAPARAALSPVTAPAQGRSP